MSWKYTIEEQHKETYFREKNFFFLKSKKNSNSRNQFFEDYLRTMVFLEEDISSFK